MTLGCKPAICKQISPFFLKKKLFSWTTLELKSDNLLHSIFINFMIFWVKDCPTRKPLQNTDLVWGPVAKPWNFVLQGIII